MSEHKQIIYAKNINDIFYQMKSIPGLQIVGGCTQELKLPQKSLSIFNIDELNFAIKHERRFDFGPGITLSQILKIGKSKLPSVFYEALKSIGNSNIRNMATLAGNIANTKYFHTLVAPLVALDAKIEIQSETETKYIPLTKLNSIPEGFIITKIQIPLDFWEVSVFKKLGPASSITDNSASFVFLANTQKGQISEIKIVFAGPFIFKNIELENKLLGAYLPLKSELIFDVVKVAEQKYDEFSKEKTSPQVLKEQFLNLVKFSLEQLT